MIKNPPATQETWVRSLGWEDPMEEVIATHSSIPDWRIPMDRGAWQGTVHGVAKSKRQLGDWGQHSMAASHLYSRNQHSSVNQSAPNVQPDDIMKRKFTLLFHSINNADIRWRCMNSSLRASTVQWRRENMQTNNNACVWSRMLFPRLPYPSSPLKVWINLPHSRSDWCDCAVSQQPTLYPQPKHWPKQPGKRLPLSPACYPATEAPRVPVLQRRGFTGYSEQKIGHIFFPSLKAPILFASNNTVLQQRLQLPTTALL